MGPAWAIRSQLLAQGVAGVQALIGRSEDRHLDFKLKTDPATAGLSEQDKKNLSKCISGFANSYGGLIVWGVRSERPSGVQDAAEVATELVPIDRPEEFKQMLEQLAPQASTPAVPDITNDVVMEHSGKGYVLTHVPVSYRGPHAANWPAQPGFAYPRYFRRLGDGNHPCDAYALIEILNRRASPQIDFVWRTVHKKEEGNELAFQLGALLSNRGPGRVREYSLRFQIDASVLQSPYSPDSTQAHPYLHVTFVSQPPDHIKRMVVVANAWKDHTIFPEDNLDLLQDRSRNISIRFPRLYAVTEDPRAKAKIIWSLYVEDNPVMQGDTSLASILDAEDLAEMSRRR